MTYTEGQNLALDGAKFGDVFPALYSDDDRRLFKAWWLAEPSVPKTRLSPQEAGLLRVRTMQADHRAAESGNTCTVCGGLMVQTGKCQTCQSCGNSPGGCS